MKKTIKIFLLVLATALGTGSIFDTGEEIRDDLKSPPAIAAPAQPGSSHDHGIDAAAEGSVAALSLLLLARMSQGSEGRQVITIHATVSVREDKFGNEGKWLAPQLNRWRPELGKLLRSKLPEALREHIKIREVKAEYHDGVITIGVQVEAPDLSNSKVAGSLLLKVLQDALHHLLEEKLNHVADTMAANGGYLDRAMETAVQQELEALT